MVVVFCRCCFCGCFTGASKSNESIFGRFSFHIFIMGWSCILDRYEKQQRFICKDCTSPSTGWLICIAYFNNRSDWRSGCRISCHEWKLFSCICILIFIIFYTVNKKIKCDSINIPANV